MTSETGYYLVWTHITNYPDDALFGLSDQFALELLGHLRIEELIESSLYGQSSLPVPLLHLVTELIPVVELFYLVKVCLVPSKSEEKDTERSRDLIRSL